MTDRVIVVGSINADIIAAVQERAGAGATVLATGLVRRSGGKGANQAAAAARAGADTRLIAAVGDDAEAEVQLAELVRDGVDVSAVAVVPGAATGLAFITVTPDGENSITVAAGANSTLHSDGVRRSLAEAAPALVVLQTEVPREVIEAVADWCHATSTRLIFNNGPFVPVSAVTLATADPLVVNEHEAKEVCTAHGAVATDDLAGDVARLTGARSVVVTMGDQGCEVVEGGRSSRVPAERAARVVDTTGAGDTFLGTLAAALVVGPSLAAAVGAATVAAAESVTWTGARPPRA